jgi:hypothetical protein
MLGLLFAGCSSVGHSPTEAMQVKQMRVNGVDLALCGGLKRRDRRVRTRYRWRLARFGKAAALGCREIPLRLIEPPLPLSERMG